MYASVAFHLPNLLRLGFAFILLFMICPRFIFIKSDDTFTDAAVSNFIRMVFLLIILGYILVVIKLFEVISVVIVLLLFTYEKHTKGKGLGSLTEMATNVQLWIYDYLDEIINPSEKIKKKFSNPLNRLKLYCLSHIGNIENLVFSTLFAAIFVYAAYLRLFDAFINAAPTFSDAYTILSWTKHINNNILFFTEGGGIYPRGYDFILGLLQKFSFLDALLVVKYVGPLNGVFTSFGLYFVISRLTGNKYSGLLSAAFYGILGFTLSTDWERQAGTNSQEFALIFVLPSLYYFYRYFLYKRKEDLITGFCGVTIAGFVHSLVMGYIGMGMGILGFYALAFSFKNHFKGFTKVCIAGIASVAISLIPFGIGFAMGVPLHGSSVDYLTSQVTQLRPPSLKLSDYLGIGALIILFMSAMYYFFKKKLMRAEGFILLFSTASFVIYYWGAIITKSEVLVTRSGEMWALCEAVCIGFGWNVLITQLPFKNLKKIIQPTCIFAIWVFVLLYLKPGYIIPYKMEWNEGIEQYYKIRTLHRPNTWAIVSQKEGYSLVLGKGVHMYVADLLKDMDPLDTSSDAWEGLPLDIYIYQEKNIFKVNESNSIYAVEKPYYDMKEQQQPILEHWIEQYMKENNNMSVFFEDENLRILHIHREEDRKETVRKIWEN